MMEPMRSGENNYAFIDSQNVYLGVQRLGWKLDFKKFRIYLREKYGITKAYLFIGYLPENQKRYNALLSFGYDIIFKTVQRNADGIIKGNCDAELVLQAMIDYANYDKALITTGDGDFTCLVKHLDKNDKFECLLAPSKHGCARLLREAAKGKWLSMETLRNRLAHQK